MDDTDRWMDGGRVGVFLPVGSFGVIECVGTQGPTSPGRDKINVFFCGSLDRTSLERN